MADAETVAKHLGDGALNALTAADLLIVDDEMATARDHLGRDRPNVKVVHADDLGELGERPFKPVHIETFRGAFEEDIGRIDEQPP